MCYGKQKKEMCWVFSTLNKPRQSGEREIPTHYANIIVVLITDGKEQLAKSFLKKTGFLTKTV